MFDAIENAYHYFFQSMKFGSHFECSLYIDNYEDALSYFVKVDLLPQPTGQGSYDSIQKALNLAQSLESDILVHIPYIVRDYLLCLHKRFCFLNGPVFCSLSKHYWSIRKVMTVLSIMCVNKWDTCPSSSVIWMFPLRMKSISVSLTSLVKCLNLIHTIDDFPSITIFCVLCISYP